MIAPILVALALQAAVSSAAPNQVRAPPTVTASGGTFVGKTKDDVQQFYGIPFAEPPVGNLRFRLPVPILSYNGTIDASEYGPSCPQQAVSLPLVDGLAREATDYLINSIFGQIFPDSEDCLTLNVVKPANANANSRLPVVVWIFGGGFELGSTSMYDGAGVVAKSQSLGQPVVFVSMNYRLSGLGFLASKEVRAAGVGNLGLQDQREALRWIKRNIAQFGGDPSKVTIWGESAGGISAALQMAAFNGNTEGLFRGAFMQSGAAIPVGPLENGQGYYDDIVRATGCAGAADTLDCLRGVPYDQIKAAIDDTPSIFAYQSLRLAWLPREDGVFLTENPYDLVRNGKVAPIPYVMGNCDDEGTLFSLSTLNVTTDSQFRGWLKNIFLPGLTDAQVDTIAKAYPANPLVGSPYGTGLLNMLSPQNKRIASFQGDGVFEAPRRWFMRHTVGKQPVWAYMSRRLKALPVLGAAHATDLLNSFFLGQEMQEHLINFVNKLDPNTRSILDVNWPQYDLNRKRILVYRDGLIPLGLDADNHRESQMDALNAITLVHPV